MPAYTVKEEILSSIAHGLGELLAVASLTLLVTLASVYGNAWSIVSCAIFGSTMMLMYGASTLYHAVPIKPHAPPLVRAPVNSFEFHPCGRTPQAVHLARLLRHPG